MGKSETWRGILSRVLAKASHLSSMDCERVLTGRRFLLLVSCIVLEVYHSRFEAFKARLTRTAPQRRQNPFHGVVGREVAAGEEFAA